MPKAAAGSIVVVDASMLAGAALEHGLRPLGFDVVLAADLDSVDAILRGGAVDAAIVLNAERDAVFEHVGRAAADQGIALLCAGERTIESLQRAMRCGVRDLIDLPIEDPEAAAAQVCAAVRTMAAVVSGTELRRLRAQFEDLKLRFDHQGRSFDDSQEAHYLDLSRMVTIIRNIMDGIVFADCDANISLLNAAAEDLLGTKSFMTIGKPISELAGQPDIVGALQTDSAQVEDRGEITRTVEVHHSEQDLLYIRLHTSQVMDYQGNFAGTLTVMKDVTAEYKADQIKNQYLSIVAHELRTPLTGIKTFSTMMVKGSLGPLTESQQRVVESMREQSLRLEHQIDKLINLGHLESEEYGQDLEVFDVRELLSQAVAPFEQSASDRQIDLVFSSPPECLLVKADRSELRRAFQALVENAVKFTMDQGKVEVMLHPDADCLHFCISDTGVGVDPRYQRRIFEKFFQVEDPLTRHHGGAGLGLFFASNIIGAHGSKIEVESNLGQGARFSFELARVTDVSLEAVGAPVE